MIDLAPHVSTENAGNRDDALRALGSLGRWYSRLVEYWADGAPGWAPEVATEILSRSRLDRLMSLCACLSIWLDPPTDDAQAEGQLILAWTNLGALVEGTLKLLLSIFAADYEKDPVVREDKPVAPDNLFFDELRQFYVRIFLLPQQAHWGEWLKTVQERRNAVHAFKDRDIGAHSDFLLAVCEFEQFRELLESRIPYHTAFY